MAQENWNCDTADGRGCQQKQEGPVHCTNNCGLLGSAATMNLCSKCFGDLRLKHQGVVDEAAIVMASAADEKSVFSEKSLVFVDKSFVSMSQEKTSERRSENSLIPSSRSTESDAGNILSPPPTEVGVAKSSDLVALLVPGIKQHSAASSSRHSIHKCFMCRKRTGILGFKCRCGNVFCAPHRYSDKHNCPFDYKAAARVAISKANPVVKAPKVEKI